MCGGEGYARRARQIRSDDPAMQLLQRSTSVPTAQKLVTLPPIFLYLTM